MQTYLNFMTSSMITGESRKVDRGGGGCTPPPWSDQQQQQQKRRERKCECVCIGMSLSGTGLSGWYSTCTLYLFYNAI
jgi:hypothetical protein